MAQDRKGNVGQTHLSIAGRACDIGVSGALHLQSAALADDYLPTNLLSHAGIDVAFHNILNSIYRIRSSRTPRIERRGTRTCCANCYWLGPLHPRCQHLEDGRILWPTSKQSGQSHTL